MSEEHPYTVVKTATIDSLLRDIVWYLRDVTEGVSASLDLIDTLEQAASQLAVFPRMGAVPASATLARRGYRRIILGTYVVFYKVDDERRQVVLYGLFHNRRDYEALL